jgi:hypothetical protein
MFLPRAAGLQRQEIQTDAVFQKYFFISCQKTPSPMPLKVRGIFERSMSIHYDSIQRAVLKQGPEVGSDPVPERSGDSSVPLHLPNLRRLREAKPDRYMAFLRRAWRDIKAELDSGRTLKDVCKSLNADGISIAYPTLRTTVGRLRRERAG